MAVGTPDSELRLAQETPLIIPSKIVGETRLDTLLARLDSNKGVVFTGIVIDGQDSALAKSLWMAIAPHQAIYHPRNMEVFAKRLLDGIYPNQHGDNRDLTSGYWHAVRYGFTDPDAIAHTVDSKTTKPELFKAYGLTEHSESTTSRGVLLTFYPDDVFAQRAKIERLNQINGFTAIPDLPNGYLLNRWIERSKKGEDPFAEPPSLLQRMISALGTSRRD